MDWGAEEGSFSPLNFELFLQEKRSGCESLITKLQCRSDLDPLEVACVVEVKAIIEDARGELLVQAQRPSSYVG